MTLLNENDLMQQIQELIEIVEEFQFQDVEAVYIEHLKILQCDLSNKKGQDFVDYLDYLDKHITDLKLQIIDRFSVHNEHLTENYLNQLLESDRILFAELNYTTKSDDCHSYLQAKEQYTSKYKDMLFSLPEINSLSTCLQEKLLYMAMHVAELNFLLNLPWTIAV